MMVHPATRSVDLELWPVLLGVFAYWVFILIRAILWRAVPWYFKIVSLIAYPLAMVAMLFSRYEHVLGLPALVLIVVGFVFDGLWRHTDLLGEFDDPRRKARPGRHRT